MKFCSQCGQGNTDDSAFCVQCGTSLPTEAQAPPAEAKPPEAPPKGAAVPPPGVSATAPPAGAQAPVPPPGGSAVPQAPPVARTRQTDGMCVASLITGIGSFLVCPLLLAVLAVIFGNIGRRNVFESGGALDGDSFAVAGMILGWINIAVVAVVTIIVLIIIYAT